MQLDACVNQTGNSLYNAVNMIPIWQNMIDYINSDVKWL